MPLAQSVVPAGNRKLAFALLFSLYVNLLAVPAISSAVLANASLRRVSPAGVSHVKTSTVPALAVARQNPSTQQDSIRQIQLPTNDLVYDKKSGSIFASVPSIYGAGGNSIMPIAPLTNKVGDPIYIGSEPGKLAISDNGQYIYTALGGSGMIRRFDVASQTPGLQFSPATNRNGYIPPVADMAVAPGNPNSIAVSLGSNTAAGIAVFDDGSKRSTVAEEHSNGQPAYIEFGATADALLGVSADSYGQGNGGYSHLLRINVNAQGATLSGSTQLKSSGDFRYDNGRLYMPGGQVLDAGTGALLGSFADVGDNSLVVPDSSVGRVYFLTNSNQSSYDVARTIELKAYDINSFALIGTLTIGNVKGAASSLVRWGSNGLAFRTGSFSFYNTNPNYNQVYLIQTTLIPSSDPVPLPSPTPAPTPTPSPQLFATYVRQLPLPANDLIFDPSRQTIYASVPSAAGERGNSITGINPATAELGDSLYVGSEPNRLALSDDNQFLYAALDGARGLRRVDLAKQSAELQLSFPSGVGYTATVFDFAVLPGSPHSIAVSKNDGVYIFDDAVRRSVGITDNFPRHLKFSANPARLFSVGTNVGFQVLSVNSSGVTVSDGNRYGAPDDLRYDNHRVYSSAGQVYDADTLALLGTFNGIGTYGNGALSFVSDSNLGRIFFLSQTSSGAVIQAYDEATFLPVGAITIPKVIGQPGSLIRWGTNGLAFRTAGSVQATSIANYVYLIQSDLVSAAAQIPVSTPSPTASPSPTPLPIPPATDLRQVVLPANDIIFNPADEKLYASLPGNASANGNTITQIDPATATTGASVFIGSEPGKLAITDNGQYIYAALNGANSVRRFDTQSGTAGLQFGLGNSPSAIAYKAFDLATLPGSPNSIAVSRMVGSNPIGTHSNVAVYDDGTMRASAAELGNFGSAFIESSAAGNTLYAGYTDSYQPLVKIGVAASGLTIISNTPIGAQGDFHYDNGRLYFSNGQVYDAETGLLIGTCLNYGFPYSQSYTLVLPDSKNGRIYFLNPPTSNINSTTLIVHDINTLRPIGSVALNGVTNTGTNNGSLVRWGQNGLAFRSGVAQYTGTSGSAINLIRSALVSPAVAIPTQISFSTPAFNLYEGNLSATIIVYRSGDVSGTSTVDYATSDGTADQRTRYLLAFGTLTFAPGETQKTFTVLTTIEANLDGRGTVNLMLSNVTGATLVAPFAATLTLLDKDTQQPFTNPVDNAQLFVRQHYLDFLNRVPDVGGLNYWTSQITICNGDPQCINSRRVSVSAAFFIEQEFQLTGNYVYRMYKATYGQLPTYAQFMPDRARINPSADQIEASKQQFAQAFVQRPEFLKAYPPDMQASAFVDQLIAMVKATTNNTIDLSSNRATFMNTLQQSGRSSVVRQIAEDQGFQRAEYNNAFVLMQYFGYLRRDPDASGYQFWLDVLNNKVANNYRGMVCAFITSAEYQNRFGSVRARNDSICGNIGQ